MDQLLVQPQFVQLVLGIALGALALLCLLRPAVGLALTSFGLVLMAADVYAHVGPTSPLLTNAAIYLVGGMMAAGLAGFIRMHSEGVAAATPQLVARRAQRDNPTTFFDDVLENRLAPRTEHDFNAYLRKAEQPVGRAEVRASAKPMRPPAARLQARRPVKVGGSA